LSVLAVEQLSTSERLSWILSDVLKSLLTMKNRCRRTEPRDVISWRQAGVITWRDVTSRCVVMRRPVPTGQQRAVGQVSRTRHRDDHHQVRPVRSRLFNVSTD